MANYVRSVRVTKVQWVEYHSHEWEVLVERGWVTMHIEDVNGVEMARMIWQA